MNPIWYTPDLLFDGQDLRTGQAVAVQDGMIHDTAPASEAARPLPGILTPGFVDLQVNGGGGKMLNGAPTAETVTTLAQAHRRFGTVALMPTVITDHPDVIAAAADAVLAARHAPGVLGLHIEGPHISHAKRGTHDARFIRPLDDTTLTLVAKLRDAGLPVMITLAPEAATPDQITALAQMGALVSLGHTNATAAQIEAAIAAGARCATHLFNAMSPMSSRAPGAVGAVINSALYAGIIVDGHHVEDSMVGLALRARAVPDRMMLVSDAMATVGGPDHFTLYGQEIALRNGRLINAEGNLAGAHMTQADGVHRLIHHVGVDAAQALRMAISIPANCLGQPKLASLTGRPVEDAVLLGADFAYQRPLSAYLNGQ